MLVSVASSVGQFVESPLGQGETSEHCGEPSENSEVLEGRAGDISNFPLIGGRGWYLFSDVECVGLSDANAG